MDNRRVAQQYAQAAQDQDLEVMGSLMDAEIVVRYPQSGEVIRGRDAYLKMLANYPTGLAFTEFASVKGTADTVVVPSPQPFLPPTVTVFGGDRLVIEGGATYPDGSFFHFISIIRLQGGRVVEETDYFAAPFDAPEWRREYVES